MPLFLLHRLETPKGNTYFIFFFFKFYKLMGKNNYPDYTRNEGDYGTDKKVFQNGNFTVTTFNKEYGVINRFVSLIHFYSLMHANRVLISN